MEILYGVQTTGHGHLVRSTPIIRGLRELGHQVHVLLSGPEPDPLWLRRLGEPLSSYPGLTFAVQGGEIRYLETIFRSRPFRFLRDVKDMQRRNWDLIVTDYEPLTAWHGRIAGQRRIGIGHLYAFMYEGVPMARGNLANRIVLRHFAPADVAVGSHWDRFGAPLLPPVISPEVRALSRGAISEDLVLVYLPWESRTKLIGKLRRFPNFRFRIYDRIDRTQHHGNVEVRPLSRHDFAHDLTHCRGVMANAGFTLSSEALHLGISLLVKPIGGQIEQESNGVALKQLGLASVSKRLSSHDIADWLMKEPPAAQNYPDATDPLIDWLDAGATEALASLSQRLWTIPAMPAAHAVSALAKPELRNAGAEAGARH